MPKQGTVENRMADVFMYCVRFLEPDMAKNREANFLNDFGVDSLGMKEIIMSLEEEFDIDIPDEDAWSLATVGDFQDYIKKRLKEKR